MSQRRLRLSRSRISSSRSILHSIVRSFHPENRTRHAVPPLSHDAAARLRTSVANDENQTQGDATDRVDEGPRRGDNALKESFWPRRPLERSAPEAVSHTHLRAHE